MPGPASELDRVWHWLAAALERYGKTHTKEDIRKALETGGAQLWPMPRAAILTTIEYYPTGLKELRGWLAGGDLSEIVEWEPIIAAWAKEQGCQRILIAGRRGWLRAFTNYHEAGTMLERKL